MTHINNVLLIDDDEMFNFLHKKIISISGFANNSISHIKAANALCELKKMAEENEEAIPEIIFLDINMPEMNGWQFLEEFEKFPPSISERCSVYMLSSSIDPTDIERSRTYRSVKDFISKPLSFEILEEMQQKLQSA